MMIIIIIRHHVRGHLRAAVLLDCAACWTNAPEKSFRTFWTRVSSDVVYQENRFEALTIIQNILQPRLILQYSLCDRSIMMNKSRTNRETFSGKFLYLVSCPPAPPVSLPRVHGNGPTVQILAGFVLFVFLPLYVPAAGLLGLFP